MNTDGVGDEITTTTGSPADLARSLEAELCPVGLPVITARMLNDVAALRAMRDAGPVHHVNMGGRETGWLVTTHEAAARALSDPHMMGEHPLTRRKADHTGADQELVDEEDLFFLPEREHTRLRQLITRQLTHRRVTALTDRIQREVDKALDAMPRTTAVNFFSAFARPLPVAVLCELLGIPESRRQYIQDYVYRWIPDTHGEPVTDHEGIAMARYLTGLIEQRRFEPRDDLISAMTHAPGGPAPSEVLSAVRLLLVAGNRPVTRLLVDGVEVLLRERAEWQRLGADPSRIEATVEELLRVVTPTVLSSRYVKADTMIDGVPVTRGDGVHCALGAANRDPERFPDPEAFDPDRWANPHLAFGLGRKHCLGAALARAEARVVFATLVRRFPAMRPARDCELADGRPNGRWLPVVLAPPEHGR
jgi:cytochrome P450